MYQVYRQPIPAHCLLVEDLPDGEVKMGSFRGAFGTGSQTARNLIRLSFTDPTLGPGHTLMANDEHDKRQWMANLAKVTDNIVHVSEVKRSKDGTAGSKEGAVGSKDSTAECKDATGSKEATRN